MDDEKDCPSCKSSEQFYKDICDEKMKKSGGTQVAWPRPHDKIYDDDRNPKPKPRTA